MRQALLQSDPAVAEKFARATIKGLLYALANRTGSIAILARSLKVRPDLAAKIYDASRPATALDGTVGEESQKESYPGCRQTHGPERIPAAGPGI